MEPEKKDAIREILIEVIALTITAVIIAGVVLSSCYFVKLFIR